MIPGIGAEAGIFLYAALAGVEAAAAYHVLVCFRKLVPHSGWAVSLEDFIYWLAASIYIFRKMYDTTYGSIRWFCVWDAVRSGGRACGDQKDCETMCRKMRKKGKNGKIVQKSKERK